MIASATTSWCIAFVTYLATTRLVDEVIGLSPLIFGLLMLFNISAIFLVLLFSKKITFELIFTGFTILFIFSKLVAGLIESDPTFITRTDLFGVIDISDEITKNIFFIYAIVCTILFCISTLFRSRSMEAFEFACDYRWNLCLHKINSLIIYFAASIYLFVQCFYIVYVFDAGYLSVFADQDFWGLGYRDLLSRMLYANFSIAFILATFHKDIKVKAQSVFAILFLILELLPGQRGHVVLFCMALLIWRALILDLRINPIKFLASMILMLSLMFIIDMFRGSASESENILSFALNGFGNPLNFHQFSLYYQEALMSYNVTYSTFGIEEYLSRIFGLTGPLDFSVRSGELWSQTAYLGHKVSGLVNYDAWLAGYGTGSGFLPELWMDVGLLGSVFVLTVLFVVFYTLAAGVRRSNAKVFPSLVLITVIPYFLYIPRGSLSTVFPELISVVTYWCFVSLVTSLAVSVSLKKVS